MFYNYDVNIPTRICYMLLIPDCDRQTDTHTQTDTHDGIYCAIASRGKKIYTAVCMQRRRCGFTEFL